MKCSCCNGKRDLIEVTHPAYTTIIAACPSCDRMNMWPRLKRILGRRK